MTHSVEVVRVDYTNRKQRSAIPYLLYTYAKGLLGFRSEIKKPVLDGLVPGLERTQNAVVLLARTGGEYMGMAICFVGFKDSFLNQEAGSQLFMTKHIQPG